MNKTQTKLLELARTYGGFYSIATCRGRGPKGGKLIHGNRERDAMFALEKAGLIVITERHPWEVYNSGYKQSGTSFGFKLV